MKVNKILFSKLKAEWDILKMKAAYIEAEKAIIQNPSLTGFQENTSVDPKAWTPDEFWATFDQDHQPVSSMSIKDIQRTTIENQIAEVEETARKLLAEEKYELMQEAKEIWQKLKQQLDNLK